MELIRLKPIFKQTIWGGNKIKKEFSFSIDLDNIGECWMISAHSNGDSIVTGCKYENMKLSELYKNNRELFGNLDYDSFPLLTKIIDAKSDLSIQVHPDDDYAYKYENKSMGKTECWYVLAADINSKIIIGHKAKDKNELEEMICNKKWIELIREVPVKKGDFFMIEPGTLHAIKGGTLILETQESSDITYRVYDYDRLQNDKLRPLHIDKSLDVIKTPYIPTVPKINPDITINSNMQQYASCDSFTIWKLEVHGETNVIQDQPCMLCTVIFGNGYINDEIVKKGDSFILPNGYGNVNLTGNMDIIVSSPKQKIRTKSICLKNC